MYKCRRTKRVVQLLAMADQCNRVAKQACTSDQGTWYRKKDRALDQAIREAPEEFVVDSMQVNGQLVLGITHRPSGRRIHMVPNRLTLQAQVVLHRMARSVGLEYNFLRFASEPVLPEGLANLHQLSEALSHDS
ncbi:MAG: hypothetical protein NTV86_00320 [Planctomycetota bacterium]|nr:hypothetical protein [Planctomycetota bacterium]